jgi:carbon monoxide dehydrogenase subunit G
MPEVNYKNIVNAPMDEVWGFVSAIGKWAPFLKGYQKHEEINDKESIWTLKGDVGVLSRTVDVKVNITDWDEEGKKVEFTIEGINEKASGGGTFIAVAKSDSETELTFNLTMSAGGMIGPVVNVLLKPMLKPVAKEMADKIKDRIEELRG